MTARLRKKARVLVVGLGNLLLADDGVGVHAVREFRKRAPRGVVAADVGTAILDALHLFERADKVLAFDAMQAGGNPGTIYRVALEDIDNPPVKPSLHDFGLRSAFEFLPGHRPEVTVLGVEPELIGFGMELSAAVQAAVPRLVEEALAIASGWRAS
jgi:hydrogenase maturation protease